MNVILGFLLMIIGSALGFYFLTECVKDINVGKSLWTVLYDLVFFGINCFTIFNCIKLIRMGG